MFIHGAEPFERYDPYSPRSVQILNRPVVCAKGGGGGSSSGKVDYPGYMKGLHGLLIAGHDQGESVSGDTPTNSLIDALNAASGNSPFSGAAAYDPDTDIVTMLAAVAAYNSVVDNLVYVDDWETMVEAAVDKIDATLLPAAYISAAVTAFGDNQDDRLENEVLPRFKAGMRDIGAVMTSAFVMGQGHIEAMSERDVAKFEADLSFKMAGERLRLVDSAVGNMSNMLLARVDGEKSVAALTMDANKNKVVIKSQQAKDDLDIDEKDARWDLDIFTYAGNMLAAIGGGTAIPGSQDAGKPSALSGALGGAAAGAMIGNAVPGIGTVTGAVVGGIGGLLSSFI